MKKTSRIITLITLLLAALFAFSACDELPPFINPQSPNGPSGGGDKYVISVTSAGGLPLSGVKVTAKKDGAELKSGISVNGKIELALPLDEYELSFSSLPDGYYIEEGKTYVTSAESYDYEAIFPSKVIESGAPTNLAYSLGDVMYDFRFTDTDDNAMWLSDLVETNKAVVLNFWYRSCGPCRSEFPALERSYQAYADKLKVLAISNQDRQDDIRNFKANGVELPLTFSMGQDTMGLTDAFGVSAFPTTVVIDRYGVIAYMHSGSITNENDWKSLFDTYTSDDYVQTPAEDEGGEDDGDEGERVLPTGTMPSANDIATAIADLESFEGRNLTFHGETEDEYSWPWKINPDGKSVSSTNVDVDNSYAILYVEFDVQYNDRFVFDYAVSSEGDDILYVITDGQLTEQFSGENVSGTYNQLTFSQSDRVSIAFVYQKDVADMLGTDTATLSNLRLTVVDDVIGTEDVRRDAARKPNATGTAFTEFVDVELGDDGYYYVTNDAGARTLLYTDLISPTQWTRLRYGNDLYGISSEGGSYERGVWPITFWMINGASDAYVILNGTTYTEYMFEQQGLHTWTGYYTRQQKGYVPVDEKMRAMLTDFAIEFFNHPQGGKFEPNENTWLEFCYYFDHFGPAHAENEDCWVTDNPALGMTMDHAVEIEVTVEKQEIEAGTVVAAGEANNRYPIAGGRGVRHRFVAPKDGVYAFRSHATTDALDAMLWLYDSDRKLVVENDECLDYDRFDVHPTNSSYYKYIFNFGGYIYLNEGEVCYPVFAMSQPQTTGIFPYSVTYEGATATKILHCTTGEGLYTYDEVTLQNIFIAVPVARDDFMPNSPYQHVINGDLMGTVYIDFTRANFFDNNGHSVYDMIENGIFDYSTESWLPSNMRKDHTLTMRALYNQSISGKTADDPYYGLLPATEEIVSILNVLVEKYQEEGRGTQAWRQFAVYDMYYGPEA